MAFSFGTSTATQPSLFGAKPATTQSTGFGGFGLGTTTTTAGKKYSGVRNKRVDTLVFSVLNLPRRHGY